MSLLLQTPRALVSRGVRRVTGARSPLAGRTVMITGASSGIGEETALEVARRGGYVVLVARRAEDLQRVLRTIENDGGSAATYVCDLTDGPAVDALVAEVLEQHGGIDYLVNNAGRSIRRSLDLAYDRIHDFERTMAINYTAPVRLTLGLLPVMRAQRFGHVVNIVTWGIQIKAPRYTAYIASKTALDTWARIAGRETWADNVTFTNMRFGLVQTPMTAPTEAYAGRGESAAHAARRVVRALEDRPIVVNTTLFARVSEVANVVTPRLADYLGSRGYRFSDDSAAARRLSSLTR